MDCIVWLFLKPPFEILPTPNSLVVDTTLCDFDVFVRFAHHYDYVTAVIVVIPN